MHIEELELSLQSIMEQTRAYRHAALARPEQARDARRPNFANRTSFAPETIWTKHNERNRNRTKTEQNQQTGSTSSRS
jgi:hypothetical protein